MSGLSGFWTVYLKKPLKNRARFERFQAVYLKNHSNLARFLRFFLDKPLKTVQITVIMALVMFSMMTQADSVLRIVQFKLLHVFVSCPQE